MPTHPPSFKGLLSDRSVRFWGVVSGIVAVLTLLITLLSGSNGTPSTTTTPPPKTITTAPPNSSTETNDSTETTGVTELERWKGKVRITDRTLNLDHLPPSNGDPALGTISFESTDRAFDISTYSEVAMWTSNATPDKQECINAAATQALSDEEKDSLPARQGQAFCLKTFESRVAYLRVTQVGATYAMAQVTVWEGAG